MAQHGVAFLAPGAGTIRGELDVGHYVSYVNGQPRDDASGCPRGDLSRGRARVALLAHVQPIKAPCRDHVKAHGFESGGDAEWGPDPDVAW